MQIYDRQLELNEYGSQGDKKMVDYATAGSTHLNFLAKE